jgi:hypothetical protein
LLLSMGCCYIRAAGVVAGGRGGGGGGEAGRGGGNVETNVNATGNVLLCVLEKNGFKTGVTVVLIILRPVLLLF